jgi:hypothetical protein
VGPRLSILSAAFYVCKAVTPLYDIKYIVGFSVVQEGDFVYGYQRTCNQSPILKKIRGTSTDVFLTVTNNAPMYIRTLQWVIENAGVGDAADFQK